MWIIRSKAIIPFSHSHKYTLFIKSITLKMQNAINRGLIKRFLIWNNKFKMSKESCIKYVWLCSLGIYKINCIIFPFIKVQKILDPWWPRIPLLRTNESLIYLLHLKKCISDFHIILKRDKLNPISEHCCISYLYFLTYYSYNESWGSARTNFNLFYNYFGF